MFGDTKLMAVSVQEILQKIFDSEIHLSVGWMWDGGVDYKIGDLAGFIKTDVNSTGNRNIRDAIIEIAVIVAKEHPRSEFTKWWDKEVEAV